MLGSAAAFGEDVKGKLTGAEETPPVTTSATGQGTIHIGKDKSVSGTVKTKGVEGIAALRPALDAAAGEGMQRIALIQDAVV